MKPPSARGVRALGLGNALEGRLGLGERVRESRDRRDSGVQLLAVDLVERVVGRVVDVEVARGVLDRREERHARGAQRARCPRLRRPSSRSRRRTASGSPRRPSSKARPRGPPSSANPGHAPRAAVGLDRGDVRGQLGRVGLRVGARAREAVLLVRERDDAKRAARPSREPARRGAPPRSRCRGPAPSSTAPVPEVPRIEVPAEERRSRSGFSRPGISPTTFAGLRVRERPRAESAKRTRTRLPSARRRWSEVGVGIRERRRRDLRDALLVADRARVRKSGVRRAHGTNEGAHGAQLRGARGGAPADGNRRAVTRSVGAALHDLPDEDDLAFRLLAERVDALEGLGLDDVGLDPARGRPDAAAERAKREPERRGRDDLAGLLPALPVRHGDGFGVDVREALRLERRPRPTRPRARRPASPPAVDRRYR